MNQPLKEESLIDEYQDQDEDLPQEESKPAVSEVSSVVDGNPELETPLTSQLPPSPPELVPSYSPTGSISSRASSIPPERPLSSYSHHSYSGHPHNMHSSFQPYSGSDWNNTSRSIHQHYAPHHPYQTPTNLYYHPTHQPIPSYGHQASLGYGYPQNYPIVPRHPYYPDSQAFSRQISANSNSNYPRNPTPSRSHHYPPDFVPPYDPNATSATFDTSFNSTAASMMPTMPTMPGPSGGFHNSTFPLAGVSQYSTGVPPFPSNQPYLPPEFVKWYQEIHRWYRLNWGGPKERMTPLKYTDIHARASFGPLNQLIRINGKNVEIFHLKPSLFDDFSQISLSNWPGPLANDRTEVSDVAEFIKYQEKSYQKVDDDTLPEVSRYNHQKNQIWKILLMLIGKTGEVSGPDLAEFLFSNNPDEFDFEDNSPLSQFRKFLTLGMRKAAIEIAQKNNLWAYASVLTNLTLHTGMFNPAFPPTPLFENASEFIDSVLTSQDSLYMLFKCLLNRLKDYFFQTESKLPVVSNLQQFTILLANDCKVIPSTQGSLYTTELLKFIIALRNNDSRHFIAISPCPDDTRRDGKVEFSEELLFMNEIFEFTRGTPNFDIIPFKVLLTCKLLDFGYVQKAKNYCQHLRNLVRNRENINYDASLTAKVNWDLTIEILDELESRLTGHLIGTAASVPRQSTDASDKDEGDNYERDYGFDTQDGLVSRSETEESVSRLAEGLQSYSIPDGATTESNASSPRKSGASSTNESAPPLNQNVFGRIDLVPPGNPYMPKADAFSAKITEAKQASSFRSVPESINIGVTPSIEVEQPSLNPPSSHPANNTNFNNRHIYQPSTNYSQQQSHPIYAPRAEHRQRSDSIASDRSKAGEIESYTSPSTPDTVKSNPWTSKARPTFEMPVHPMPAQDFKGTNYGPPIAQPLIYADGNPTSPTNVHRYEESEAGQSTYSTDYPNYNFNSTTTNGLPAPQAVSPIISPIGSPNYQNSTLKRVSLDEDPKPFTNLSSAPSNELDDRVPDQNLKEDDESKVNEKQKGFLGYIGGAFSRIATRPKKAILPDDTNPSIVWDEKMKRWVNKDEKDDSVQQDISQGPPKIFFQQQNSSAPYSTSNFNQPPDNVNSAPVGGFGPLSNVPIDSAPPPPPPPPSSQFPADPSFSFSSNQAQAGFPGGMSFLKSKQRRYIDITASTR